MNCQPRFGFFSNAHVTCRQHAEIAEPNQGKFLQGAPKLKTTPPPPASRGPFKTEALWWLEQRCLEKRKERCIFSKIRKTNCVRNFFFFFFKYSINTWFLEWWLSADVALLGLVVFFCVIQDSLQLHHVAVPPGSQPAGHHLLWLERLPSQACHSTWRSATWGAQQILFSAETLHQSDYKTEVCTQFSAETQRGGNITQKK